MDLDQRHVFITGAARRLGRAIAERLMESNIKLTAHYFRSKSEVDTLGEMARARGRAFFAVSADLGDVPALQAAVAAATKRHGPVDVLINSASDFYPTPALSCSEKDWDHFQAVNLKGQFFLAQACAKTMQGRRGLIINLGDVNGDKPLRGFTPYVVAKAGVLMLTRNLAAEWAPHIRVNSISPGPVLPPENFSEEQKKRALDRTLLKRLGTARDIAEAAAFLIANDYLTGFDLKVDGGAFLA